MSIECQNCATPWSETDERTSFYFESLSFAIGDYTSPKSISDLAESMTFCPSCPDRRLRRVQKDMNEEDPSRSFASDRVPSEDRERAGSGDADATHKPGRGF